MNSVELNKIACVALFTSLAIFGLNIMGDIIYTPNTPEKPAYSVEVADTSGGQGGGGAGGGAAAEPDIATLLASSDPAKGEKVAKKCAACHTFDQGGKNGIGPNLYGIVGGNKGAVGGFSYSSAITEKGGKWDFEALNQFFKKPSKYLPGTKMAFAGLKKGSDRANLIAYLNTKSASPLALPEPPAAPAEAEAAPPAPDADPEVKPEAAPEKAPADKQGNLGPIDGKSEATKKAEGDKSEITGSITSSANQTQTPIAEASEQKKNKLQKHL